MIPFFRAEHLNRHYRLAAPALSRVMGRQPDILSALDDVSLTVGKGEIVGIVGESGCGKSTFARIAARLADPTTGKLWLGEDEISAVPARAFHNHRLRRAIQMVFQDPASSLDPRWTALDAIAEPVVRLKGDSWPAARRAAAQWARLAGLPDELLSRYPHQLSGGQKARVGIARAIAPEPALLILDEPTSALDASVQSVILRLLAELRDKLSLSYIFISHDLNVVRLLCQRVYVMYLGRIVESGPTERVFSAPCHPYSRILLSAMPQLHAAKDDYQDLGEPGSAINIDAASCRFAARCPRVQAACRTTAPVLRRIDSRHFVECHLAPEPSRALED